MVEWSRLGVIVAGMFLIIVIILTIFIWNPELERQEKEVKNLSCKELKAYILDPKGFSAVAKDVYMVNCL